MTWINLNGDWLFYVTYNTNIDQIVPGLTSAGVFKLNYTYEIEQDIWMAPSQWSVNAAGVDVDLWENLYMSMWVYIPISITVNEWFTTDYDVCYVKVNIPD